MAVINFALSFDTKLSGDIPASLQTGNSYSVYVFAFKRKVQTYFHNFTYQIISVNNGEKEFSFLRVFLLALSRVLMKDNAVTKHTKLGSYH